MKTQFDFHYTDTDETQPDVVLPVEFQIQVDWNAEFVGRTPTIKATIDKILNNEQPDQFEFSFSLDDVKDIPEQYCTNGGTDEEQWHDHDHLTTGFEWCADEIEEYIIDNRASWVKV